MPQSKLDNLLCTTVRNVIYCKETDGTLVNSIVSNCQVHCDNSVTAGTQKRKDGSSITRDIAASCNQSLTTVLTKVLLIDNYARSATEPHSRHEKKLPADKVRLVHQRCTRS